MIMGLLLMPRRVLLLILQLNLGYIVSSNGVSMDPTKVSSLVQWPVPRTTRVVLGFLGPTDYYRQFIQHYGLIAQPLTELLQKESKGSFQWIHAAQQTFDSFRQAITTAPILAMPDFSLSFIVECDASNWRCRRCLDAARASYHCL